jgi:hypothetical protein
MGHRPLDHKPVPSGRQSTGDHGQALDVDGRLVAAIGCVEVRAPAVVGLVVIHPYGYPVEHADTRHRTYVRIQWGWNTRLPISSALAAHGYQPALDFRSIFDMLRA